MRKVYYDSQEGILLRQMLMAASDKEDLAFHAKELGLRRLSGLRKAELAEKISNELLQPQVMRRRTAVWTSSERALFERSMEDPFVLSEEEADLASDFLTSDYAFLNAEHQLRIPVDVARLYKKLDTREYRQYARKLSWLSECLYYASWMYGIFPKSVLLTLFNSRKGLHVSEKELEQLCADFPKDLMMCCWSEDKNTIVADDLMKPAEPWRYESLQKEQDGKDFYFPETSEVEDFYRNGYPAGQAEFRELGRMMMEWGGVESGDVATYLFPVWKRLQNGADLEELMDSLGGLAGEEEERCYRIVSLVQNLNNRTRLRSNRGHTAEEIFLQRQEKRETAGPLTVAPGSAAAADLLEAASDELAGMGIRVDLESHASQAVQKDGKVPKIYPNDPCPCGSGKKYKKCCGRNAGAKQKEPESQ